MIKLIVVLHEQPVNSTSFFRVITSFAGDGIQEETGGREGWRWRCREYWLMTRSKILDFLGFHGDFMMVFI